jgi:hypothetical protein
MPVGWVISLLTGRQQVCLLNLKRRRSKRSRFTRWIFHLHGLSLLLQSVEKRPARRVILWKS